MKARELFDKKEYAQALLAWEEEFKTDLIFDTGYSGTHDLILEAAAQVYKKSKLAAIDDLTNFPEYYRTLLKAITYYSQNRWTEAIQHYAMVEELLQAEKNKEPENEFYKTKINFYYLTALTWVYRAHCYTNQYSFLPLNDKLIANTKAACSKAKEIAEKVTPAFLAYVNYSSANDFITLAKCRKANHQLRRAKSLAMKGRILAEAAISFEKGLHHYYDPLATYYTYFTEKPREKVEELRKLSLGRTKAVMIKQTINNFYDNLIIIINKEENMQDRIKNLEETVEKLTITLQNANEKIVSLEKSIEKISYDMTEQQFHNLMLFNGAQYGNIDKINHALKIGNADIQAVNENGQTALHLAINHNHLEIAEFLLKKCPLLFNKTDNQGTTPMQLMAQTKDLILADWLYEKGKTISEEEFDKIYDVASAEIKSYLINKKLFESAKWGHIEGIKYAIKKNVLINSKAADGETALHKAVYNQYKEIVQLLIEHGANPIIRNNKVNETIIYNQHETALQFAIDTHQAELISIVATPALIFAAHHGNMEDIVSAIKAGAKLNGVDASGQTALHKAVIVYRADVIDLLLRQHAENKIDIELKDASGKTPCDLANEYGLKIKIKDEEKPLASYLLKKFGGYEAKIKLMKKSTVMDKIPLPLTLMGSINHAATNNPVSQQQENVKKFTYPY